MLPYSSNPPKKKFLKKNHLTWLLLALAVVVWFLPLNALWKHIASDLPPSHQQSGP